MGGRRIKLFVLGNSNSSSTKWIISMVTPVKNALRVTFLSVLYLICYFILFFCAFVFSFSKIWGIIGILVAVIAAVPAIIAMVLVVLSGLFRSIYSALRTRWSDTVGHIAAMATAVVICSLGIVSGEAVAIALVAPQIKAALSAYRNGFVPTIGEVEIISTDPEIVAYRTGDTSSVADPGSTDFIVLDRTGRFADLSSKGRARDLAGSDQLRSRNYRTYCYLGLTHWIGPYYFATSSNVNYCEPR